MDKLNITPVVQGMDGIGHLSHDLMSWLFGYFSASKFIKFAPTCPLVNLSPKNNICIVITQL